MVKEPIVCPNCGGTNTKKTKMALVFLEEEQRTRQKIVCMKCIDCFKKYCRTKGQRLKRDGKPTYNVDDMLKYAIFDIEKIDIEIK
jgi:hypothetical protein